jgi:hypothetical protein
MGSVTTDDTPSPQHPGPEHWTELLHVRLERIEGLLASAERAAESQRPAWQRRTRGEQRWAVMAALLVAVWVQWMLPERFSIHPHWLLPALELFLMALLLVTHPHRRIEYQSRLQRVLGLLLAAAVSLANGWSAVVLVHELLHGTEGSNAAALLTTGGGIWLTNVIAFSLWYWEWDRGGAVARALGTHEHPDFLFPQMMQEGVAPDDWEPQYVDYLYVALTNATAFSPTDTMPLSRWAKLLMSVQAMISLLTLALIVSRAVGILR